MKLSWGRKQHQFAYVMYIQLEVPQFVQTRYTDAALASSSSFLLHCFSFFVFQRVDLGASVGNLYPSLK